MRIAVVSDIHGNLLALQAVAMHIQTQGVENIVNLGDSLSGPLLPLETAQFLMDQGWIHIAGNQEKQILKENIRTPSDMFALSQLTHKELAWIASLNTFEAFSEDIFLCHGTPSSCFDYLLESVTPTHVRIATAKEISERLGTVQSSLVLCGHTHFPRSVRLPSGQLIVNPGSVGLPAYDGSTPFPHMFETGAPDARYAVVEKRSGVWFSELFSVPYQYTEMVHLAEPRGRKDWAYNLGTGYAKLNGKY